MKKAATRVLSRAFLVACAIVAPAVAYADSATGGTYVTTLPTGAEVWFDGTYVGRSPVLIDGLGEGRHAFSVLKSGWQTQDGSVTIQRGTVIMSSVRLGQGKHQMVGAGGGVGTLVIRDAPPGAELVLDASPMGSIGPKGLALPAGTHDIVVKTARGRTARAVTIYPDIVTDVILREPGAAHRDRSAVVAPAEDYLPTNAFVVAGRRIVVRYGGHVVVAHFGDTNVRFDGVTTDYDGAPEFIGGKLYLPLELLEKLSGDVSKSR